MTEENQTTQNTAADVATRAPSAEPATKATKKATKKTTAPDTDGPAQAPLDDHAAANAHDDAAVAALTQLLSNPAAAARALAKVSASEAKTFLTSIERLADVVPLTNLERRAKVSAAQMATMLGISRQAYAKWKIKGVPASRLEQVTRLVEAADQATSTTLAKLRGKKGA